MRFFRSLFRRFLFRFFLWIPAVRRYHDRCYRRAMEAHAKLVGEWAADMITTPLPLFEFFQDKSKKPIPRGQSIVEEINYDGE